MASLEMVDKLRERAGVTYEDAREALDQSQDDMLDALIWLENNGKVSPPRAGYFTTGEDAGNAGVGYGDHLYDDSFGSSYEGSDRFYGNKKSRSEHEKQKDKSFKRTAGRRARKDNWDGRAGNAGSGKYKHTNAYYYDERDSRSRASAFFKSSAGFLGRALHIGNTTSFEITRLGKDIIKIPLTILVAALLFFFRFLIILLPVGLFFGFRYRISGNNVNENPFNQVMDSISRAVDGIKDAFRKNRNNK